MAFYKFISQSSKKHVLKPANLPEPCSFSNAAYLIIIIR